MTGVEPIGPGCDPAGDDGGKQAGAAAGANDEQSAGPELRDRLAGECGRHAFGDAAARRPRSRRRDSCSSAVSSSRSRAFDQPASMKTRQWSGETTSSASPAIASLRWSTARRLSAKLRASDSGVARLLVDDALHAFAGEQRDGRRLAREAALDRERLPFAVLGLGEAEAVLARRAQRRAVDLAGPAAADVADHQLQRAADRRVGAVALAERVDAGIHADAPSRPARSR